MISNYSKIVHNLPIELQTLILDLSLKYLSKYSLEFQLPLFNALLQLLQVALHSDFKSEILIDLGTWLIIKNKESERIYLSALINDTSKLLSIINSGSLEPIITVFDKRISNNLLENLDTKLLNHCQFTELRMDVVYWENEYDWWNRVTHVRLSFYERSGLEELYQFTSLGSILIEVDESITEMIYSDSSYEIEGLSFGVFGNSQQKEGRTKDIDWVVEHLIEIPNLEVLLKRVYHRSELTVIASDERDIYEVELQKFEEALLNARVSFEYVE